MNSTERAITRNANIRAKMIFQSLPAPPRRSREARRQWPNPPQKKEKPVRNPYHLELLNQTDSTPVAALFPSPSTSSRSGRDGFAGDGPGSPAALRRDKESIP